MYYNFLIHSSVSGQLSCFHVLTIVKSAAMNIGMHVLFSILGSSGHMPSSGITGSNSHFIFSFLRTLHTVLYSGCISLHSAAIFWESLSRLGISSSLNFWSNSPVKPSGPGLLFVGRFWITFSISILVIGLFIFSIFSWFSFGRLYFSKNSSVSSKSSVLLVYSCPE